MDYLPFERWGWFSKYKSQKKILVICEMDRKGFGIRHEITPEALFKCRNVKRVQFHRWLVSTITFVNTSSESLASPPPPAPSNIHQEINVCGFFISFLTDMYFHRHVELVVQLVHKSRVTRLQLVLLFLF